MAEEGSGVGDLSKEAIHELSGQADLVHHRGGGDRDHIIIWSLWPAADVAPPAPTQCRTGVVSALTRRRQHAEAAAKAARLAAAHQDLVDAPPVHVDDLEAPAVVDHALAFLGDAAELGRDEAREGMVARLLEQLEAQGELDLVDRGRPSISIEPSWRRTIAGSSPRRRSGVSLTTTASSTSATVTTPSTSPYSSTTSAMLTRLTERLQRAQDRQAVVHHQQQHDQGAQVERLAGEQALSSRRVWTTPSTSSRLPLPTTKRLCPLADDAGDLGRSSSTSSQTSSTRGVMIARTGRSASRSTRPIISCSCWWKTPVRVPSAIRVRTSSSVTHSTRLGLAAEQAQHQPASSGRAARPRAC